MIIKNLKDIDLSLIVECLSIAFADYFVPMPSEVSFWENRWEAARVNYELSFGMFSGGNLIGIIMNGIDVNNNKLTAFNTGTGVIPECRGNQVVDKIYDFAIPLLKQHGVTQCTLEVIKENDRAIRLYERIGFTQTRELKCFKGKINVTNPSIKMKNDSPHSLIHSFAHPIIEN